MKRVMSNILSLVTGTIIGSLIISKVMSKNNDKWREMSDKHLALMLLFNRWMTTKQEGKSIVSYFKDNNIQTIAIYGMSYVGERLYAELKNSDIEVKYVIDKNVTGIHSEVNIVSPNEELELVDAIVITPIFYFDEISDMLCQKTDIPVLSLEDILRAL